jgi:hypothetical protein
MQMIAHNNFNSGDWLCSISHNRLCRQLQAAELKSNLAGVGPPLARVFDYMTLHTLEHLFRQGEKKEKEK